MKTILSDRKVFVVVCALFVAAATLSLKDGISFASTNLTIPTEPVTLNGPTLPPGPWDEGRLQMVNGPTLPPGPWDEGRVLMANGPTLPPGPWDEGRLTNRA